MAKNPKKPKMLPTSPYCQGPVLCNPVCLGYSSLCIFQCAITQNHYPEMGKISSWVKIRWLQVTFYECNLLASWMLFIRNSFVKQRLLYLGIGYKELWNLFFLEKSQVRFSPVQNSLCVCLKHYRHKVWDRSKYI